MDKLKTIAKIDEQYKKFSDSKKEDVQKLLEWAEKQAHLPRNITELEMLIFLHSNYYRMEATKNTIDNYFTCKTHMSALFHSRDITADDMVTTHEIFMMTPLPKLTKDGYKVLLVKLMNSDPTKFVLAKAYKLYAMVCDALLYEEGLVEGHVVVFDMEGLTMSHLAKFSVAHARNWSYFSQEALPFRLKGLHYINIVPFVDKLLAIIKPLMKKEHLDVFYLHSTMDSVYEKIECSIFPKDYPGGEAESLAYYHEHHYKHLIELREFFLDNEEKRKVDESLRAIKPKHYDEIFGMEGNFRKLDID